MEEQAVSNACKELLLEIESPMLRCVGCRVVFRGANRWSPLKPTHTWQDILLQIETVSVVSRR